MKALTDERGQMHDPFPGTYDSLARYTWQDLAFMQRDEGPSPNSCLWSSLLTVQKLDTSCNLNPAQ